MSAWLKKRLQRLAISMARTLNRFLEWLFESQNPAVVFVRETIRRNRVLMFTARAFIRTVRGLPSLKMHIRERLTPSAVRRLQSVMAARATGGSLTASELDRIWDLVGRRTRVLVLAEGP